MEIEGNTIQENFISAQKLFSNFILENIRQCYLWIYQLLFLFSFFIKFQVYSTQIFMDRIFFFFSVVIIYLHIGQRLILLGYSGYNNQLFHYVMINIYRVTCDSTLSRYMATKRVMWNDLTLPQNEAFLDIISIIFFFCEWVTLNINKKVVGLFKFFNYSHSFTEYNMND